MQKQRIDEIDILRGLLFLFIAFQHSLAAFIYNPNIAKGPALVSSLLLTLVRLAVPMFIFITGLVLFYNHGDVEFHYWDFIKKRFTQVFIPYFVWTLIYFTWTTLTAITAPINISALAGTILHLTITGEACYHLWFMAAIIQFYILFPLFRVFVLKTTKQLPITLILGLLGQIGLLWLYHSGVFDGIRSPLLQEIFSYRDRIFISWFFYFILGGYAGLYVTRLTGILKRFQTVNILVYLLSLFFVCYKLLQTVQISPTGGYIINNTFTGPLNYLMVVYIIASLGLVYLLAVRISVKNKALTNGLETFGRYSFGCYFIHALILALVGTLVRTYIPWVGIIAEVFISFIACALLSLVACIAINKIPRPFRTLLLGKVPLRPVRD
ncbi:MAG TPA: acyltransferase [Syntrophomonadaceae bacterium]|nr:acyltransferase [Syntrophomonadaceae bacterium]